MHDYSKWSERLATVTTLSLDPKNPRIPELGAKPSQREIAAELVEHDNVYELAKDIANLGYFPTELLIGIEEDGKDVIVEGNRRLAALKLLLSPELAPEESVKKFRKLSDRVPRNSIAKIHVSYAPSREAAAPLIVSRHTGLGVQGWKPAQQAKFLRTLVTPDASLDDVAKQLGMSKSDLLKNLKTDTMYQIACSLDLPEDVASIVRSPRGFNASVLERLVVESAETQNFLGVEFDERGGLRGKIDQHEFRKGFGRMITDIASGEVDTRSLNKALDIKKYLDTFGSDSPDHKRKGAFSSDSLLGRTAPPGELTTTKSGARGGAKRESPTLIPPGIKCRLENPRINDIFRELRKLKVRDYTNATGVLLRILLEMIVANYMERTGTIQPILQKARTKDKKGKDWSPSLRQMLNAMLADPNVDLPPLARKGLSSMVSNQDHPLTLDKLDQFVHNHYVAPTDRELRRLWALLSPLMVPLLQEPTPPASTKVTK